MKQFKLQWKIPGEEEGRLIRDFLKEKQISKRALTDIKFAGGDILLNDKHATVRQVLKEGDMLTVLFPEEAPSESMKAEDVPLEIIYEDEHCIVLNKQPGIPSIPSREHPGGTLANGLLHYFQCTGVSSTIHIVNRLDRDTSGLMLAAKHRFSHSLFSALQKQRKISRTYEAVAEGIIEEENRTIDAPIGRKGDSIIAREVRPDGQQAITHFDKIQSYGNKTRVRLQLETGRTHQIRVHMQYIGHPLCGDTLYGGSLAEIKRHALHSSILTFWHPFYEKKLFFTSGLPEDMKALLK
ncbi:RluA family pseudouridine synthase [Metabacillus sp. RGM 3146]|uniref:RluA family pseudouridine synthase n=1 Tax=Metabacillus sp. RGM 3146 TaxID=3401092 RepID=UPI003B9D66B8